MMLHDGILSLSCLAPHFENLKIFSTVLIDHPTKQRQHLQTKYLSWKMKISGGFRSVKCKKINKKQSRRVKPDLAVLMVLIAFFHLVFSNMTEKNPRSTGYFSVKDA